MPTLDYPKPDKSNRPPKYWSAIALLCIVVAVNVALVATAAADRSWGALQIMVVIGPVTNLAILVLSLVLLPVVWRISGSDALWLYWIVAFATPVLAIFADAACIWAMDLHGC